MDSLSKSPKSLIAKLAEACNAVGGVEKKGRNEFQHYAYVKAADVAKAIRHELFKRGILVLIDEKEWSKIGDLMTNAGHNIPLMQLRADVIFQDEHDKLSVNAFATAIDSGDKAIYKAKTGLLKYALRGLGLIPDEKDDPEFDESVDEATADVTAKARKGSKKAGALEEARVRAFSVACSKSGKTAQQQADYLRARWSCASVVDITPEEFTEAMKWATQTSDLAQQMKESVAAVSKKPANGIQPKETQYEQIAGD